MGRLTCRPGRVVVQAKLPPQLLTTSQIRQTVEPFSNAGGIFETLTPSANTFPYYTSTIAGALATLSTLGRTLAASTSTNPAADRIPYLSGSSVVSLTTFTAFGRVIVGQVDAAGIRTTLELGSIATQSATGVSITGGAIAGCSVASTDFSSTQVNIDGGTADNVAIGVDTAKTARVTGLEVTSTGSTSIAFGSFVPDLAVILTGYIKIMTSTGGTANLAVVSS